MKEGANNTGPQTAHTANGVGLELTWQLSISPVVSVRRGEKEHMNVKRLNSTSIYLSTLFNITKTFIMAKSSDLL